MVKLTLPPKRQAFADAYALTNNATTAARQADYKHPTEQGSRLLRNVQVQAAVALRKQEIASEISTDVAITPAWIIQTLASRAANPKHPAASVSALRTLADIHGMLGGGETELPLGLAKFLQALGRGITEGRERGSTQARELAGPPVVEVEARLVSEDGEPESARGG